MAFLPGIGIGIGLGSAIKKGLGQRIKPQRTNHHQAQAEEVVEAKQVQAPQR